MAIKATLGGKFQLTDLVDPTDSDDAATKQYVDDNVGSSVVANPGGSPAQNLNTVTINDTDYNIVGSSGTTVVANPGGSPATDLTTVTIGSTDYNIPGGASEPYVSVAELSSDSGDADADTEGAIAIGSGQAATGINSIAIGTQNAGTGGTDPSARRGIAIGHGALVQSSDSIAFGTDAHVPAGNPNKMYISPEINSVEVKSTSYDDTDNTDTLARGSWVQSKLDALPDNDTTYAAGDGITITGDNNVITVHRNPTNSYLNLTSAGLSVDTAAGGIATREYVDFEFVENGSYANINADDNNYIVVELNGDLDNDTEVHIGTVGHFRLLSFHGDLNSGTDFTGAYLRVTISDSTGYYKVNFAAYESSDNLTHIYLQNSVITGSDVLSNANTGDTVEIDHDTDAEGAQPIHIGHGLTHDDNGSLVVDTEEILDTDVVIFGNPDDSELVLSLTGPELTAAVAHQITVTIPSAPNNIQTFLFRDIDGTEDSLDINFIGSANQFAAATTLNNTINSNADFVSSTLPANSNVVTITWDNAGDTDGTPLVADETLFEQAVVNQGADSFYTYPDGFTHIDLGTGILTNEGGTEISFDTELLQMPWLYQDYGVDFGILTVQTSGPSATQISIGTASNGLRSIHSASTVLFHNSEYIRVTYDNEIGYYYVVKHDAFATNYSYVRFVGGVDTLANAFEQDGDSIDLEGAGHRRAASFGFGLTTQNDGEVDVDSDVIVTLSDIFGEFNGERYRGRVEIGGGKGDGTKAIASGNNSVAIGVGAQATHVSATALGTAAVADHDNSTAVGASANADTDNQIMLGSGTIASIKAGAKITPTDSEELVQKHYVDNQTSQNPFAAFSDNATPIAITIANDDPNFVAITDTALDPGEDEYQLLFTTDTEFELVLSKAGNDIRKLKNARLIRFASVSDVTDNALFMVASVDTISNDDLIEINLIQPAISGDFDAIARFNGGGTIKIAAITVEEWRTTEFGQGLTVDNDKKPAVDTETIATRTYVDDNAGGGDTTFVDDGLAALAFISDNDSDVDFFASKNDTFDENDVYILANEGEAGENWYGCYFRQADVNDTDLQSARYLSISDGTDTGYFRVLRSKLATTDNSNKLVLVDIQTEPFQGTFDLTNYRVLASSDTVVDSDTALSFKAAMDVPRTLFADQFDAGTGITLTNVAQTNGTSVVRISATGTAEANLSDTNAGDGIDITSNVITVDTEQVFIYADNDAIRFSSSPKTPIAAVAQVATITVTDGIGESVAVTWTVTDADGTSHTVTTQEESLASDFQIAQEIQDDFNEQTDFITATRDDTIVTLTWDNAGAVSITKNGDSSDTDFTLAITTAGVDSDESNNFTSEINLGTGLESVNDTEIQVDTTTIATRTYVDNEITTVEDSLSDRTAWVEDLDSDIVAVIHHDATTRSFTQKISGTPAADEVVVDTTNYQLEFRNEDLNLLEISSATILNLNYNSSFGYYRIDDVRIGDERTTIYLHQHQLGVGSNDSDTIDMIGDDDDAASFVTIYADIKDASHGTKYAAVTSGGQVGTTRTIGSNTALQYTVQRGVYWRVFVDGGEDIRVQVSGQTDDNAESSYQTIASKTY